MPKELNISLLKTMDKWLLHILLLLSPLSVVSQEIEGVVRDKVSGVPLESAHIRIDGGDRYTLSRKSGRFSYKAPKGKHSLTITYIGYDTLHLTIDPATYRDQKIQAEMTSASILLGEGVITAESIPDTIFESEEVSVLDFIFDKAALLILTYDKTPQRGTELWWVDENNQPISTYPVPGEAVELVYNYQKQVLLICEDVVYEVSTSDDGLDLFQIPKENYEKFIQPVVSKADESLFFTTFSEVYPAFKYMSYETVDSVYDELIAIEDTFMMELYRAEYRFSNVRTRLWAYNKQLETGIDKEIWVGATYFTQSLYYQPIFAPLFKRNDTLAVFDHYSDRLFLFDTERNPLDSMSINYHKKPRRSGWEEKMVQDEINGKIYAVFQKAGFTHLKEVSLKDGSILNEFKLHFKYVERIRIYNGMVYYVYRPYESIQKKFLYREMLK